MPEKNCRRCLGTLQVTNDDSSIECFYCINCGHREYPSLPAEHLDSKSDRKRTNNEKTDKNTAFPIVDSKIDRRGKVTTTAEFSIDGQRHKIELSVARKSLLELSALDRARLELMLGNIFAHPLAHQKVRARSLHGRHAEANSIEFWATAREIEGMLSAWLNTAPPSDSVLKRAFKIMANGKGHSVNHHDKVIVFLIERNWLNIKSRDFPDKRPTRIPQFLRSVRRRRAGTVAAGYVHSASHQGSGVDPAAFPTCRNPLPDEKRGRLLASAILGGGWYLRQISDFHIAVSF